MKLTLLLTVLSIVFLSGCSTAFKAGQTPDDVYYSPGRDREDTYVKEEQKQIKQNEEYQEYVSSQDDRYLRMKVANRNRWNSLDNFDYWYDSRYDFNTYYGNTQWNRYNAWNPNWNLGIRPGYGSNWGWSSPIYTVVKYTSPAYSSGGYTSGSNISAYKNRNYNNNNIGYKDPKTGNFIISNNRNNSFGDLLKRVFTGSSDNSGSYDRPARTFSNSTPNFTPASPPSSSAGGSSGGYNSTGTSTSTGRGGKGQ